MQDNSIERKFLHDIINKLTVISGNTEMIQEALVESEFDKEKVLKRVETILRSSQFLLEIAMSRQAEIKKALQKT